MMRVRSFCGLWCAALILATAGSAAAQEFRATIKGTVADTSQAALPGATVTAQNQNTNEVLANQDPLLLVFNGKPDQIHVASRTRLSGAIIDAMMLESLGWTLSAAQSSITRH